MELLMGQSLKEIIEERRLNHQEIVKIGVQVAEALDFSNQRGIVHRDIKPSNIIMDPEGQVKITDFGIAHIDDPTATQQTIAGEILGTPLYMSPEQVMSNPVDGRTDLYSLGVILYELTTGKSPFKGNNLPAIFQSILQDTPPAPELADTSISRPLSNVIMKSLEKDPAKRFQTGIEMAKPLKACLQRRKIDIQPPIRTPKKTKYIRPMALLIAVVLIIAVVIIFLPKKSVLHVESDPAGANVYVNEILKGHTPLNVELLLGKYEIRLSHQNYYEWEAQIQLDEERETPLFVRLVPMDKE
jgi:serine/threonine protein kinase